MGALSVLITWIISTNWTNIIWYGTASWYSVESCKREGKSGICADGEPLVDQEYSAASWYWELGDVLLVRELNTQKGVYVILRDRGPSKKLFRAGRIVDLSVAAFKSLEPLEKGIIDVKVERVTSLREMGWREPSR